MSRIVSTQPVDSVTGIRGLKVAFSDAQPDPTLSKLGANLITIQGPTFCSQDEKAVAWSGQHFTEFFQFLLSKDGVTLDFFAHIWATIYCLGSCRR